MCDELRKIYDDAATAWFIKCKYAFAYANIFGLSKETRRK